MKVVVCVKQIPDPADPGAIDPETKTLKRDVKLILDESDSYGVEMALQLVDGDGEVVLVSMAPNSEVNGLRTALAMGADSARARRFYEREGWHLDGGARTENIGGAPVAEVRYRIDLGPLRSERAASDSPHEDGSRH